MNKDIETMIELQRCWDNVLRAVNEIEKAKNSIGKLHKELDEKKKSYTDLESEIKNTKMEIKQKEVDLAEKDEKAKKLESRRNNLKTEKELAALKKELENLNSERGTLEEKLIELFDNLEEKQSALKINEGELAGLSKQAGEQIKNLEDRIGNFTASHDENKNSFDALIGNLPPAVSSRFIRYAQSGNGKGISLIDRQDICGGCNFKIPAHLAQEASKNDKIVNCTNCGRFIYRAV